MSKNIYEFTVELLDRKFMFLMKTQDTYFNLELERFVAFLAKNELVRDVANKLKQEVDERKATYQYELKRAWKRACELKERLLTTHPETADQDGDFYTFTEFDLIVSDEDFLAIPQFQEKSRRDESKVKRLIDILCSKRAKLEDRIKHQKLSTIIDGDWVNDVVGLRIESGYEERWK